MRNEKILTRMSYGTKAILRNKWKVLLLLFIVPIVLALRYTHDFTLSLCTTLPFYELYEWAVHIFFGMLVVLICIYAFVLLGTPISGKNVQRKLERIGFTNSADETPILLAKYKKKNNHNIVVWEFNNNGLPLQLWNEKRVKLETVLNCRIVAIKEGKDFTKTILHTVSSRKELPQKIYWDDRFLQKDSFVLVLGENLNGKEIVNLSKTPHILLGGSTGSGKTLLLKFLLMQCVKKRALVYIADFKGGVDFPSIWHEKCTLITREQALLELLEQVVDTLEQRKKLFRDLECSNIDEYNAMSDSKMQRIIIACDEIAEVLDKTGLSKEDKEFVAKIESRFSLLARQARAFGLHLILATQRPDANILPGQIRNNIDFRICGKADSVLSQIILDNSSASEKIAKDSQGQFITNTGVMFQGYLFDERKCFD